jgi:hypothetical protein
MEVRMWDRISETEKRQSVAGALEWQEQQIVEAMAASLYASELEKGIAQAPWDLKEKIKRIQDFMEEMQAELKRIVCREFNYCRRRNEPSLSEHVALGVAIADELFKAMAPSPIPIFLISVYLIRRGLDDFCEC